MLGEEMQKNYELLNAQILDIGGEEWYDNILCETNLSEEEKKISSYYKTLQKLMGNIHTVSEEIRENCFYAVLRSLTKLLEDYKYKRDIGDNQ